MNFVRPFDAPSSWLANYYPKAHPALRLFCFPFAGGGPSTYRTWSSLLPGDVEVCPVAFPGRETRIREPFITQFAPLIRILLRALYPLMNRPFAFFGHSMGSLICYELARALREEGGPTPVHMFLSAYSSPSTMRLDRKLVREMSDEEFIDMLRGFNGTPAAVLNSPELLSIFVPILRADFSLEETYEFRPDPPLECPFTVFGGLSDTAVREEDLRAWSALTSGPFALHMLEGDHFFIHSSERFNALLSDELRRVVKRDKLVPTSPSAMNRDAP